MSVAPTRTYAFSTSDGTLVVRSHSPINAQPMPSQIFGDEGAGGSEDEARSNFRAMVSGKNQSARTNRISHTNASAVNTSKLAELASTPVTTNQ